MSIDLVLAGQAAHRPAAEPTVEPQSGRRRFDDLLRRHHGMLRRVASGVLLDADALDDVLQEAYLKAYRNLPRQFANEAHEAAWLSRIVYRCCLDELRRRKRRREQASDAVDAAPAPEVDTLTSLAITRALAQLDPGDRLVLLLVDLAGFDYDGAATVLRVPRGTAASRLHAARRRFRELLDA